MTRQIHDQFAKEYLEELLTPLGTIRKSKKVKSEVQEIDVWFEPFSSPPPTELPLGLLGKMAATSCLFEPFRNPPTEVEIRSCLSKLYAVHGDVLRKAKRSNKTLTEAELPVLWILTPTFSARMIEDFGTHSDESNWLTGVYFLAKSLKAGIIVIHQLPVIDDTLWLRLLGKGGTQKRAVEELVELPECNPFRENLLEILANWRKNLELRDNLSTEEQEDIMNLSPAYLQQREEWKQEGIQQGSLEERYSLIAILLEGRFGSLDSELSGLVERIAQLPISERTGLLLSLANLSREELLQRFREN
ncbi:MAG: hypothetical protein EWV58_06710 [Microcystis aeruginosa Ma_MB_F_20061100_S19]|uniref:Flagellar assembly protein H n=1 Tax=Microcystis aeruginosa SPC777 TaxID=482300 RepID=S3J268_MICAE|nr:hypothetical protein [Microcystis aeruginosa]NCR96840.1 hypothetical protein [Microcystis aeruginosa L311-01]OCY14328.1 MAG: hypothetical protein BEV12_19650 [Microcystis aeruginosa CACIAM 03]TRU10833.1 MAG: hypothetical protein EWV59_11500 [Microcystis aeruginosa Ma_MB_F_20061100_S19D]TRU16704.1 MAG: hypothetical protein EWV58_06710 [Microcystis aeruginosa Ma_MB_F_20061100_S19]EPF19300.1 hypothetical protein MAESPC_04079 [Microcystis aeruginosa SPC777]